MRYVFAPAIRLMNQIGYTWKFCLLWLMSALAIVVVVHSLYNSLAKEIEMSRHERAGVALAAPLSRLVQLIQQQRGRSAALREGHAVPGGARAAGQGDVDAAFAALAAALPRELREGANWRAIEAVWVRLRTGAPNWTAEDSFAEYSSLIDQLLFFKVAFSGQYILPLDPQIDSANLIDVAINKLPLALEHLGQVRAHGVMLLSRRQSSELDKVRLHSLTTLLREEIKFIDVNFDKVGRHNPALRARLLGAQDDIDKLAAPISVLMDADLMGGRYTLTPERFYQLSSAAIDQGYASMYGTLLPVIDSLIEMRIARAYVELQRSVAIALLLFLLTAYLSIGMYLAIMDSIGMLARTARAFADGDLRERIDLGVRDELDQVGASFNLMADGFGRLLAARREDEARLRAVIDAAMDAMVQMDEAGIIVGWNRQASALFGWTEQQARGQPLAELIIPPQQRAAHQDGMRRFVQAGAQSVLQVRIEVCALHRDGHQFPVELSITAVKSGSRYEFGGFIRDLTSRKESERLLWMQANFDALTGLPNRHMFHDRLALEMKKGGGARMALLVIDLDRFKDVNDTLGHHAGDRLLVDVAARIGACAGTSATLARLGGDEFVVLLPEVDGMHRVEQLAQCILATLARPFNVAEEVVFVSASIGIALYPDDTAQIDVLLKNADQAMSVAKKAGRNRISYFTAELQHIALARRQMINDLHGALEGEQLVLYFQPIVEIASGRVHKAEALIRWRHPERGLVSPLEFIALAEETGLILEIGDWVFREAARHVKRWIACYQAAFQLSVNVSPVQLCESASRCQGWPAYLREIDVAGQALVIEITEGSLLEAESGVTHTLRQLHEAGIGISIDDFGTGYSALSYLKKFDIDFLKIDQSFVRNLATDANDMALSEAIIVMAHKLGMKVIAEGVETQAQQALLDAVGCDYAQGYLFAKPLPAEQFEALLAAQAASDGRFALSEGPHGRVDLV